MKKLLKILGTVFLALMLGYIANNTVQATCTVSWAGSIDDRFEAAAKGDLATAEKVCSKFTVRIQSGGGGVFNTLEIVKAMRDARHRGLLIETRGESLVASGATFLLAAGSPGYRHVRLQGLYLVHGIQRVSWGSQTCVDSVPKPTTDDQWVENHVIKLMATEYALLSGKPVRETVQWLRCNNTQVGNGELMVRLGLADVVDR